MCVRFLPLWQKPDRVTKEKVYLVHCLEGSSLLLTGLWRRPVARVVAGAVGRAKWLTHNSLRGICSHRLSTQ